MACSLRVAGTNGSPAISWDVGVGGYQIGNFPPLWSEWNGKYRDTVRDFWRGRPATLREFASRLTGSSDLYQQDSRRPVASVNFVTCHDGFSLTDLVAYNEKHDKANGEDSRDGSEDNRSWNCGAEGPTEDPGILVLRERQKRNFLATLLLSQGVPMLLAGDEMGRTQRGNNNAYCQDNEISWLDWGASARPRLRTCRPGAEGWTRKGQTRHCWNSSAGSSSSARATPCSGAAASSTSRTSAGVPGQVRDIAWFAPAG
jgi:glycogen debranching enzyme GlgX